MTSNQDDRHDAERSQGTVQIEVPESVLDDADGYVTVIAEPTSEKNVEHFGEWFGASSMPDDVWMLVNTETGEVEEQHGD